MQNKFDQFKASVYNVLNRHGGSNKEKEARIKRAETALTICEPDTWAHKIFSGDEFREKFKGARILGSVGKPLAGAPVMVATRWGNAGWYVSPKGGYIQITLLMGEKANVSITPHHPVTGEEMRDVARIQQSTHIKVFGSDFDENDGLAFDALFQTIQNLQVGTYTDKGGKTKPKYKGTELSIFFQVSSQEKDKDGSWILKAHNIALVDTQQQLETEVFEIGLDSGFLADSFKEPVKPVAASTVGSLDDVINTAISAPDTNISVPDTADVVGPEDCPI